MRIYGKDKKESKSSFRGAQGLLSSFPVVSSELNIFSLTYRSLVDRWGIKFGGKRQQLHPTVGLPS